MQFKGYSKSVIGSREMNQDSLLIDDAKSLYAVADGVGGGLKGEVASKMAVEGFQSRFTPTQTLSETVKYIQNAIYMEAMNQFGEALMGTTFTGVHIIQDEALFVQVGDSRLYLFDGNLLMQKTVDHEQFDDRLQCTVLISYLGIDTKEFGLKIQEESFKLTPGSQLLLCSDGLYKQLDDSRISQILKQSIGTPEVALQVLCAEAEKAEHSDNVTVVLVQIEE